MARRRKAKRMVKTYGKIFKTKAGRLGRYCYVNGKRVAFETVKRQAKYGGVYAAYKAKRFIRKSVRRR
tara:strand:- start:165 stop:368 length:204 start_codon:yes stop_codon:yes gene_type:complete